MNHDSRNREREIETRLERSLRKQVRAPKLDGRFDASVWARIAAESAPAPVVERKSTASSWMFTSNVVGVLVAVVLAFYFGLQAFTGSGVEVSVPAVPAGLIERLTLTLLWPITIVALCFGLMFTSYGRRLRSEFF